MCRQLHHLFWRLHTALRVPEPTTPILSYAARKRWQVFFRQVFSRSRSFRRNVAARISITLCGMLLAAMPAVAETASGGSETNDQTDMAAVPQHKLAPTVRQAVLLDPQVSEATARACQMAHKLGLTRAEGRPKVTATISGSRQIINRIKRVPSFSFRRTPAEAEIHKTGAHTREFDHGEKNKIYDAKLSLRYTLFDWGQRRNLTEASMLAFEVAQIDARDVLRSRSYELVRLALSLQRLGEMVRLHGQTLDLVNTHLADVRERVEAGAGRVIDLREAQLLALDQEIALNRAEAEYDQLRQALKSEFELEAADAAALAHTFIMLRPETLPVLLAEQTDKAHAIRLRQRTPSGCGNAR